MKQYLLRDTRSSEGDDPMARGEKQRRLHGAVSAEEQRKLLGQYYTVVWSDPEGAGQGEVEVLFQYQQGGSRIQRMSRTFPASEVSGTAEFTNIGNQFFQNGKIVAWRVSLKRDGREIDHRQSYLWE